MAPSIRSSGQTRPRSTRHRPRDEAACLRRLIDLTGYVGSATDCTNPTFDYDLSTDMGGVGSSTPQPSLHPVTTLRGLPTRAGYASNSPIRSTCSFRLDFEVFGVRYGLPNSLTFTRTSIFAMTDLTLPRHRGRSATPTRIDDRCRSRGQAMVEFALVAPVFFMLLFGDYRGRSIYPLLRDAHQRDARGSALRDRPRLNSLVPERADAPGGPAPARVL